jgi:RimJ/RimL family protein N-acetyltransferase
LLRRLAAADASAYHAFRIAALRATPSAFTSTWQEEAARPLQWSIRRIETNFILGAFDGVLCGTAGLSVPVRLQERHKATLFGMAVAASHAGRGIGRRLVEAIISHAAGQPHVTQVILSVSAGNEAAERLYRGCGFEVYGREPRAVMMDGLAIAKLHMILMLDRR